MDPSLKKNILIGIAAAAGLFLLVGLGWFLYFNMQFRVYQDDQYKFSIQYPKTWKVIVHPKDTVAVIFLRPKDTPLDTVQENFNVVVQPVSEEDQALATFSANIKNQMTAVFAKNLNIVVDKPLQWDWRQGREMVFEAPVPNNLVMLNAWLLREDHAYIMTFLGEINKYADDKWTVNKMVHSFKLQGVS